MLSIKTTSSPNRVLEALPTTDKGLVLWYCLPPLSETVTSRCSGKRLEGHLQPRAEMAASGKRPPATKNPQQWGCLGGEKLHFTFFIWNLMVDLTSSTLATRFSL